LTRTLHLSVTDIMGRDNATWLMHLHSEGEDQESALSDLREALLRGLRKALSNRRARPAGWSADESFLEDAVQDSLVRILDRIDQFQGRSRFLTWATSIAVHVALSELRRRRWKDVSLEVVTSGADFAPRRAVPTDPGRDTEWERRAILEELNALMDSELTEKQRTALLAELKGMPLDEIARHLGSNRNAVYKLTHDARKKLRKALEAAGFTAADVVATTAR
jgi:RNA polymerase sigma-70 factor (ECF subfamily)